MKFSLHLLFGVLCLSGTVCSMETELISHTSEMPVHIQDSLLRHVVLFRFKEDSSDEAIHAIIDAFKALPEKIPEIVSLEWGMNNSPEGLDQGFTHCFFLTFKSAADRDAYLPHPDHNAFGNLAGPHIKQVLVFDYPVKAVSN